MLIDPGIGGPLRLNNAYAWERRGIDASTWNEVNAADFSFLPSSSLGSACFDGEAFGGKESGEGVSDAGEVRGADITKTAWRGRRKRSLWRGCGRLRGER